MNDFYQEVWEYLWEVPIGVAMREVENMWEIEGYYMKKWPIPVDIEQLHINRGINNGYEFLCMVCANIALNLKEKLPENLHNRMVLGDQNSYTKSYINKWGV